MKKRLFNQATFKPMVQVHIEISDFPDQMDFIAKIWDFCIHNHIYSQGSCTAGGGRLIKYLKPQDAEKLKGFIEKLKKKHKEELESQGVEDYPANEC